MKERNKNSSRSYLGTKKDAHEKDTEFLENSRKSALWLAKTQSYNKKVDCAIKNSIRTREDIHEDIYRKVKTLLK